MIIRPHPKPWRLFFVLQGSIIGKIYLKIICFAAFAALIGAIDGAVIDIPHLSITAMGVFGVALSLFLGFRNNAAYERWWEARKLWGKILADVRALALELHAHLEGAEERRRILACALALIDEHRGHLRGAPGDVNIERWLNDQDERAIRTSGNPAAAALQLAAERLRQSYEKGAIDAYGRVAIANRLSCLAQSQAGNERIASTPLPFVYSLLVRRTTYLYCALLPFALADDAGWFAPLLEAVVAYVFFGLQAVTNELERPFADVENGLPLNAICRLAENSILEAANEPAKPPLTPSGFVLT